MKNLLAGAGVLAVTVVIMLGVSEVTIRQFLDPLDYLQPTIIPDAELGHRIAPHSSGHDAWGYRNKAVPTAADIVLIGDSQIYGTASSSNGSIASLLHQDLGNTVYSMALGGYGAAQYSILLDRAFELSPRTVLVGIYFGNDLMDAFNYVYDQGHTRFSTLRRPEFSGADTFRPVEFEPAPTRRFESTRSFLARNSVLYRVVTSRLDFVRKYEQRNSGRSILEISDKNGDLVIGIALTRAKLVDSRDPRVDEGARLTFHFIDDMKKRCDVKGVKLWVILIPTEFSSFMQEIQSNSSAPIEARNAVEDERLLFERFHATLSQKNISTIDIRKPLQDAIRRGERVYPVNDGHLNNRGNRAVTAYISQQISRTSVH